MKLCRFIFFQSVALPTNHQNIQMVNWPDHGVPKNGDHVFELIEKFRQQQSVVQNPK